MPENPAGQSKELSYYRNYKDAHIIILQEVLGTNASFTISVYSALNWIANDHGDQFRPFSASIGLIAYRAGLSKSKTSAVLKILSAITLLKIESGRGRRVYNTYTLLTPAAQERQRALPSPRPLPKNYDEFIDICDAMGIDERAADSFWELQEKNNWKRENPSTGQWEALFDWKKSLIKFDEKVEDDIENISHN